MACAVLHARDRWVFALLYDPELHHRRSIRLPAYDYTSAGAYSVTAVAHRRRCLFGGVADGAVVLSPAGQAVADAWAALSGRWPRVVLDATVVMPNHVHAIIGLTRPCPFSDVTDEGGTAGPALAAVVRAWKSAAAIAANRALGRAGPIWQRGYYEHVIRDDGELERIRQYIEYNPLGWDSDRENPQALSTGEAEAWEH